jgi:hypothetical protein
MSRIPLSKRAAELLGPPPDGPIDWDDLLCYEPRILASVPRLDKNRLIEQVSKTTVPTKSHDSVLITLDDEDGEEDKWPVTKKRWATTSSIRSSPRRVTMDGTVDEEENRTINSPVSRRKTKRRNKSLKQSTIFETLRIRR